MSPVRLRPATAADLDAIVALFLRCWRLSYAGVLPEAVLARMGDEDATALWSRVLRDAPAGDVVLAVDEAETPLGVTRFGVTEAGLGHVASLYVSPETQGMGIGKLLLSFAEEELARRGAARATLWVFSDNAPSLGFYNARGWGDEGSTRVQDEFGAQEMLLAKDLG